MTKLRRIGLLAPLAAVSLAGCGLNSVPTAEENVNAKWGNLQADYQRRADLIPNLVETVKGYAAQEKDVLTQVVEARAKATQMQIPSDILTNPEAFKKFQEAQSQVRGALARLLAIVENYPDLKSNQNFIMLQSQLEGTENRITVARKRYIEAVAEYNKVVQLFPTSIGASMRGKSVRPTFTAPAGLEKPPEVKF